MTCGTLTPRVIREVDLYVGCDRCHVGGMLGANKRIMTSLLSMIGEPQKPDLRGRAPPTFDDSANQCETATDSNITASHRRQRHWNIGGSQVERRRRENRGAVSGEGVGSGRGCAPSQKIYEFFVSKWCDMVRRKMTATCGIQKFH